MDAASNLKGIPDPSKINGLFSAVLETLLRAVSVGIAFFDIQIKLLRWNPAWIEFLSQVSRHPLPEKVLLRKHLCEIASEVWDSFAPPTERVLGGKTVQIKVLPFDKLDCKTYHEIHFIPILEKGAVTGLLSTLERYTRPADEAVTLEQLVGEGTQELEHRQRITASLVDIISVPHFQQPDPPAAPLDE